MFPLRNRQQNLDLSLPTSRLAGVSFSITGSPRVEIPREAIT
jgi:hypothetical protein